MLYLQSIMQCNSMLLNMVFFIILFKELIRYYKNGIYNVLIVNIFYLYIIYTYLWYCS